MAIQCEFERCWYAYRERIQLSDGTVRCCETGILIPEGFPYAHCQGTYDDTINPRWESWPQALEVWRWARNNSKRHGHCFPFGGISQAVFDEWDCGEADISGHWLGLWRCLCSRLLNRYAEGKKPRLHPAERASLASGKWDEAIPYTMREK